MQIEMHKAERCDISEFADKHGLIMEVRERIPRDLGNRWSEDSRYFAQFKHVEVTDGRVLIVSFGNGKTPEDAISNYANEISGRRLVQRIEIKAPLLTYNQTNKGE